MVCSTAVPRNPPLEIPRVDRIVHKMQKNLNPKFSQSGFVHLAISLARLLRYCLSLLLLESIVRFLFIPHPIFWYFNKRKLDNFDILLISNVDNINLKIQRLQSQIHILCLHLQYKYPQYVHISVFTMYVSFCLGAIYPLVSQTRHPPDARLSAMINPPQEYRALW